MTFASEIYVIALHLHEHLFEKHEKTFMDKYNV